MNQKHTFLTFFLGLCTAGLCFALVNTFAAPMPQTPLTTGFTYQGVLKQTGIPLNGTCDLQVTLWDALSGGTQIGTVQTLSDVSLVNGYFTATLNAQAEFGANAFTGQARWLALAVRCPSGSGSFTPLAPRQPLTAVPYALYALSAGSSTGSAYAGVRIVAAQGGDFTSIQAALDSVTPTTNARYLIWVAPGVYTESVTLRPYVDLAGAGPDLTRIVAPGGALSTTATLYGANFAEVRDLSVENSGGAAYAVAIRNELTAPSMHNLTVRAYGATTAIGVLNEQSEAQLEEVVIEATDATTAYALYTYGGAPTFQLITAYAAATDTSYAFYVHSPDDPALIMRSTFSATATLTSYALYMHAAAPILQDVTASAYAGQNTYALFATAGATPDLHNVTLSATDAAQGNYGLFADSATPQLTQVDSLAAGGQTSYALYARLSTLTFENGTLTARMATTNAAAYNDRASLTLQNSTLTTAGGTSDYGVYNQGTTGAYQVRINNSSLFAATRTVRNDSGFTTEIGASQLAGGPASGFGQLICAGVYDEAYTFSAGPTCP